MVRLPTEEINTEGQLRPREEHKDRQRVHRSFETGEHSGQQWGRLEGGSRSQKDNPVSSVAGTESRMARGRRDGGRLLEPRNHSRLVMAKNLHWWDRAGKGREGKEPSPEGGADFPPLCKTKREGGKEGGRGGEGPT